jgi:hypothetical protein
MYRKGLRVTIRRGKTDLEGRVAVIAIVRGEFACPVAALRKCLRAAEIADGPPWFCRLGLDGDVPDHSTFSKNRHGRFRESDLLRRLFETILRRCSHQRLVGGEAFAVDASLIRADANRQNGVEGEKGLPPGSCEPCH